MNSKYRNKWLFNEPPVMFNMTLARVFGLPEAMILQEIHFWTMHNEEVSQNCHEGEYWTYISLKDWQKKLPCFAIATIRRALDSLKAAKHPVLVAKCFSKDPRDRTLYYRINYETMSTACSKWFDLQKSAPASDQDDQVGVIPKGTCCTDTTATESKKTSSSSGPRSSTSTRSDKSSLDPDPEHCVIPTSTEPQLDDRELAAVINDPQAFIDGVHAFGGTINEEGLTTRDGKCTSVPIFPSDLVSNSVEPDIIYPVDSVLRSGLLRLTVPGETYKREMAPKDVIFRQATRRLELCYSSPACWDGSTTRLAYEVAKEASMTPGMSVSEFSSMFSWVLTEDAMLMAAVSKGLLSPEKQYAAVKKFFAHRYSLSRLRHGNLFLLYDNLWKSTSGLLGQQAYRTKDVRDSTSLAKKVASLYDILLERNRSWLSYVEWCRQEEMMYTVQAVVTSEKLVNKYLEE